MFKRAKNNNAPLIIHLITRKGQGYKPAEDNMTDFHGIDGFVPETGEISKNIDTVSYTEVVSNELLKLKEEVDNVREEALKFWVGTLAEYQNLTVINHDRLYIIID